MIKRAVFILVTSLVISSCSNEKPVALISKPDKSDMEELNRYFIQKDKERIQSYIERKKLNMAETSSGLWYQILKQGSGELLVPGDRIMMDYELSLLDGTLCYTSEESGPREIVLGRTGIEPGLYEGLLMLKPGAEAQFIIPPFLAYGLPGDGKKIPPRSVIFYKIRISGNL